MGRSLKAPSSQVLPAEDYAIWKAGDAFNTASSNGGLLISSPPKVASPPISLQGQTLVKMYYVYN